MSGYSPPRNAGGNPNSTDPNGGGDLPGDLPALTQQLPDGGCDSCTTQCGLGAGGGGTAAGAGAGFGGGGGRRELD